PWRVVGARRRPEASARRGTDPGPGGSPTRDRSDHRGRLRYRSIRLMPTVTVQGEKAFEAETGKKLVLAIEDAGIDILHRCGGNARCTTCRVQVLSGDPPAMGEAEQQRLARETDLEPNTRL